MPCPPESAWVALAGGTLPEDQKAACLDHLESCGLCRTELAAAREGLQEPSRNRIPAWTWAAAAALLLMVGLGSRRKPETPLPPQPSSMPAAPAFTEWRIGRTGEVALEPGSTGRVEGVELVLESGSAWVESCGDPVRVRMADRLLELVDGAALFRMAPRRTLSWIAEARAADEDSFVQVARGRVRILEGPGAGTERVPEGGDVRDFRGWRPLLPGPLSVRDKNLALPIPEGQAAWTAEILVRESVPSAEAALLFPAGGKPWEVPLGAYLTGEWTRLRLEQRDGRVRLTAGRLEYFSVPLQGLSDKAYLAPGARGLALKVWGGNVEVREARWRP